MVARGDLAVEVGNATVPALQKKMIKMARELDRIVITATQMMESMIVNPVPTRAEVSDVANAVLDGTDAVMLSAETAAGRYPVETVEMMASICLEAERAEEISLDAGFTNKLFGRIDQSIAMAALFTAHHLGCKAILALTESGSTALWMSRHKVHVPIYGLTSKLNSQRKMALYRNVRPLLMPNFTDRDQALACAEGLLVEQGVLKPGDTYAIHRRRTDGLSGWHQHVEGLPRGVSRRCATFRTDVLSRSRGGSPRGRRPGRYNDFHYGGRCFGGPFASLATVSQATSRVPTLHEKRPCHSSPCASCSTTPPSTATAYPPSM